MPRGAAEEEMQLDQPRTLLMELEERAEIFATNLKALGVDVESTTTDLFQVPITEDSIRSYRVPSTQPSDPKNCVIASALFLGLLTFEQAEVLTTQVESGLRNEIVERYFNTLFKDAGLPLKVKYEYADSLEEITEKLFPSFATILNMESSRLNHALVIIKSLDGSVYIYDPQDGSMYDTREKFDMLKTVFGEDIRYSALVATHTITAVGTIKLSRMIASTCSASSFNMFPSNRLARCINTVTEYSQIWDCIKSQGWRLTSVTSNFTENIQEWMANGGPLCKIEKGVRVPSLNIGCGLNVFAATGLLTREDAEARLADPSFKGTSAVDILDRKSVV